MGDVLPSQLRYLQYFESLYRRAAAVTQFQSAIELTTLFRFARMVLVGAGGDGSHWVVEVLQQGASLFRVDLVDAQPEGVAISVNLLCKGDLNVRLKRSESSDMQTHIHVVDLCFHTAFVANEEEGGVARFVGADFDGCKTGLNTEALGLDVIFEPATHWDSARLGNSEDAATVAAAKAVAHAPKAPEGLSSAGIDSAPTIFHIAADDDDDAEEDDTFWTSTNMSTRNANPPVKRVFAPEDIDAFFDEL